MNIKTEIINLGIWGEYHKPEIIGAAGKVLTVGGAVCSGIGTYKAAKYIKVARKRFDKIREANESGKISDEKTKKLLIKESFRTIGMISKYYLPAVICVGGSIAMQTWEERIMNGRYAALAAEFTALMASYEAYRKKIAEKYGIEEDRAARLKLEKVKTDEGEVDVCRATPEHDMVYFYNQNTSVNAERSINSCIMQINSAEYYRKAQLQAGEKAVFWSDCLCDLGCKPSMYASTSMLCWTKPEDVNFGVSVVMCEDPETKELYESVAMTPTGLKPATKEMVEMGWIMR